MKPSDPEGRNAGSEERGRQRNAPHEGAPRLANLPPMLRVDAARILRLLEFLAPGDGMAAFGAGAFEVRGVQVVAALRTEKVMADLTSHAETCSERTGLSTAR